jgi:uncharacterized protein (TIGR02118 family)
MKTVGLMPRRPDISRAAFRDHYENNHAPLALGLFPFQKYVRNHIVLADPEPIGFDCLSEFWVGDVAEIHRLMESPVGDIMREDELRFTDQPRIGPAVAEEILIAGPARGIDDGVTAKEILLIARGAEITAAEFLEIAVGWGERLFRAADGRLSRVTLDMVTPFDGRHFPRCDAILQGWVGGEPGALFDAAPPDGIAVEARLRTESVEAAL